MEKKQKSVFGGLNILGIPIDPTLGVGDKVLNQLEESTEAEKRKEAASEYWMRCPKCGRRVVREEFRGKGCFICGYKPEMENKKNG